MSVQDEVKKKIYPKNPLGIIALFVFFIEAISTVSLKFILESQSEYVQHLVWFIILYPSVIALLFFITLWCKRESFYSPSDFKEDASFVKLIKKVEHLEIKQKAAQLDPDADVDLYLPTIEKLIKIKDYYGAIQVGRSALKENRYDSSREIFSLLQKKMPESDALYSRTIANLAYSQIGLKEYSEAVKSLLDVWKRRGKRRFYVWHAVALAYSYFQLGDEQEYNKWMQYAKERNEYPERLTEMVRLYPEIKKDLCTPAP